MTEIIDQQLLRLQNAISNRPPYCSGVVPVAAEDLSLFYRKDQDGRFLNFMHTTPEALRDLCTACEPATFGVGQQDVYDESYRKAGKLDNTHFAPKLDLGASGILELVSHHLLGGTEPMRPFRAELYKLNVYGEGSFFKAHRDTPRGEHMFGSLVITYPTAHAGGALLMRAKDQEWTFDSAKALSEHGGPCVGYVALYSDVEHEVSLVTSGDRVTITYNLYFLAPAQHSIPSSLSLSGTAFKTALETLLADPTFLPEGGPLGFGLQHQYPVHEKPQKNCTLKYLNKCLKGCDAEIVQAASELSLKSALMMLFRDGKVQIVVPRTPALEIYEIQEDDGGLWHHLKKYHKGAILDPGPPSYWKIKRDCQVNWVTHLTRLNDHKTAYTAYGNQHSVEFTYGSVCLFVFIGKFGARTTLVAAANTGPAQ